MSVYKKTFCDKSHKARRVVSVVQRHPGIVDVGLDCGCVVKSCWLKSIECPSSKLISDDVGVFVQFSLQHATVEVDE